MTGVSAPIMRASPPHGRSASATMPLGERTGLSAAITDGDAEITSMPSASIRSTSSAMSSPASAPGDTTAQCRARSASSESVTRCAPSIRISERSSPCATARKRGTRGFWRLVMCFMTACSRRRG
jgi:hypothetical protein